MKTQQMMKVWLILMMIGINFIGFSQSSQPVNYDEISDQLSNYDDLLEDYRKGELVQLEDYRTLYYGFTFQPDYTPYEQNKLETKISELMAQGLNDSTTVELISISEEILDKEPFNLKIIYYLQNFIKNNPGEYADLSRILRMQYDGVLGAILSTGDGKEPAQAISVNHPSDEFMVMRHFKQKPIEQSYEGTVDIFSVQNEDESESRVYFDVARMIAVGSKQMGIETIEVEDDELPENGVEIGSQEELLSFIPAGMKQLTLAEGDFDEDGDEDYILVVKKEGEDVISNASSGKKEPRILMYLERTDDKLLTLTYMNANAIPCVDCGETGDDPFVDLSFEDGKLIIKTQGGNRFLWDRTSIFEFDDSGDFVMVRDEYSSYRKGKEEDKITDVETAEDFGEIRLEKYQYEN